MDTHQPKRGGGLERVPSYSRYLVIIAVLGLFAGAATLTVMAGIETVRTIAHAVSGSLDKKTAVLDFIELADVFLLATVLYIMSLGLYELFVDDALPLPSWLEIHSLDDLKQKLVGVVVVVLAVSFLGSVIKGAEAMDLLATGAGIAAVIAATGYFLSVSHKR